MTEAVTSLAAGVSWRVDFPLKVERCLVLCTLVEVWLFLKYWFWNRSVALSCGTLCVAVQQCFLEVSGVCVCVPERTKHLRVCVSHHEEECFSDFISCSVLDC